MAEKVEVVIKVSEEVYNKIRKGGFWLESGLQLSDAYDAIKYGTPLPKGHGDLVDRKELLSHEKCTYKYDCPSSGSSCDKYSDNCVEVRDIENAKPVIEADVSNRRKDTPLEENDNDESDCVNAEGMNANQISDTLIKAYNSGLLTICGGMFDEKDVNECHTALMTAFKMLKTNNKETEK